MNTFKTIEEVLSFDFSQLVGGGETSRTDRVLKSTKIEQAIYEDLAEGNSQLSDYETEGKQKLKTFDSLVNDVFQSVYGLNPKYLEESAVSDIARKFNRNILDTLMSDDNYAAVKSVCEGKELPSIGATEEFTGQLLENLDSLMNKSTGGNGKVDALEKMEQDKRTLTEKLTELLQQRERQPEEQRKNTEQKILNTANRILSKQEQSEMYAALIDSNVKQNAAAIQAIVSQAADKSLERAKSIKSAILAWGSGESDMRKNPVDTEILRRTAQSHKLRYIAQFLGRYKEMLNSKRLAGYTYGRGEKYDIEYGNKISKALTSEYSLLAASELMPLFIRKYVNKSLKQYRRREPEYKGKGDIIVCLDESASTFGENNAYGMALAMVLYEICRVNHANFALVHFSSKIKVDYFPKEETTAAEKVMSCAETFLNGGTNFELPLQAAMALYAEDKLEKPDIVFITDGIREVSDGFLKLFQDFKENTGAKLTGILLDKGKNFEFTLRQFADRVYRTSELLEDAIVENLIEERI